MNKSFIKLVFTASLILFSSAAKAQNHEKAEKNSIDQIVAVVNDHIILKSQVNQQVQQYMYQLSQQNDKNIQFKKKIWYSVLKNMVQNFVLLDHAKMDSVTVSEARVQQAVNQQINRITQQVGSKKVLEQRMGQSMAQIRKNFLKQFRQDLTIQQYRQQKMNNINITRPEVEEYFQQIPTDSLPSIPEKVALSQIVIVPSPRDSARIKARRFARQIRDSIVNHGKKFEKMARKYSDGPSAPGGGKISMYPMNQLAPNYAAAAAALKPGEISKVVKTSFGFHIIRLNKRQGEKIDTNNILIKIDKNSYNNQAAKDKLNQIRDSVKSTDKTFAAFARQNSQDPNTAKRGGRILQPETGARMLTIDQLDPALYRIFLLLKKEGDISKPKPFTIGKSNDTKKAFRIVRLDDHRPRHVASLSEDYDFIKNSALRQKRANHMQSLFKQLDNEVYIEYKVPVPAKYKVKGGDAFGSVSLQSHK